MPDKTLKKRIVIKIGTRLLVDENIKNISKSIAKLSNYDIIVVSSGAIGLGNKALNAKFKHEDDIMRNLAAAVGQTKVMDLYEKNLSKQKMQAGQVLITKNDLINRSSFLQIKQVIENMLDHNIIPIINENDTIKSRFNKFKDNDQVAIEIASKMQADLLIMLTNVEGVFTSDPKKGDAALVKELGQEKLGNLKIGKKTDKDSTGGMHTKLGAAMLASNIGIPVIIADGSKQAIVEKLIKGQKLGTTIQSEEKIKSKKRWILLTKEKGCIEIDEGAYKALQSDKSLLAIGVKKVDGNFLVNDVVDITCKGKKIAKAITDCNSDILQFIQGKKTEEIKKTMPSYNSVAKHENVALIK
jgi:glutamate 5-kinase